MQQFTVAKNGSERCAQIVRNIGDQLNLKPFAGDGGTDRLLMPRLYLKKLSLRLRKGSMAYSDWLAILIIVKLFFEMMQIGTILPL